MGKVLHGIRPSVYDKYKLNIEESFLKHKKLRASSRTLSVRYLLGIATSVCEEEGEGEDRAEGRSIEGEEELLRRR